MPHLHYESSALPGRAGGVHPRPAAACDRRARPAFPDRDKPFVWRRSLVSDVEEVLSNFGADPRSYAQGARIGPGLDLKRGRAGFARSNSSSRSSKYPRRPRPDGASTVNARRDCALVAAGRLDEGTAFALAAAYRQLRTIEHRVRWSRTRKRTCFPPAGRTRQCRAAGWLATRRAVGFARAAGRASGSDFSTASRPIASAAFERPDTLTVHLPTRIRRSPVVFVMSPNGDRSRHARLRSPAAREAFEAMLP